MLAFFAINGIAFVAMLVLGPAVLFAKECVDDWRSERSLKEAQEDYERLLDECWRMQDGGGNPTSAMFHELMALQGRYNQAVCGFSGNASAMREKYPIRSTLGLTFV